MDEAASAIFPARKSQIKMLELQIGMTWTSPYGLATLTRVICEAQPKFGMQALYEVIYGDKSQRTCTESQLPNRITEDQFDATPAGIAKTIQRANEYVESIARQELAAKLKAENSARILAPIIEWLLQSGLTPLQAGRAKVTLTKLVRYAEFGVLSRSEFIQRLVEQNVVLEEIQVPRIKPMSRLASHRANQQEQDAHERKEKEAGFKPHYSVGDYEVTQAEFLYACFLKSRLLADNKIAMAN
jgi:hypothetical protein